MIYFILRDTKRTRVGKDSLLNQTESGSSEPSFFFFSSFMVLLTQIQCVHEPTIHFNLGSKPHLPQLVATLDP